MSAGASATTETAPGSVTGWLDQLRELGRDPLLEQEIWNRYFLKLAAVARKHLSPGVRRTVDEEDVALSALNSFFAKLETGRFSQLSDRAQLWTLLTTIATYKAINLRARHRAKKRGGGNVRGDSGFAEEALREIVAVDPGPQELAEFRELATAMLGKLEAPMRKIAHDKLMGRSDWEIAEELGVSPRTVTRKVARIRSIWSAELETAQHLPEPGSAGIV